MPKLNSRPPKYCKLNGQAVVYRNGRPHYLGRYGSPESKAAYSRFIAEIQANPAFFPQKGENNVTICELSAACTAIELAHSADDAQAQLGHKTVNMTKHYSHAQLTKREALARNRQNPFETEDEDA